MKLNFVFVLLVISAFVLAVWFNNWLYFLTVFGVAGIIIAVPNVHLVLKHEDEELPPKSVNKDVHDYVKKAKEADVEHEDIKKNLKDNGWEDHEVDIALLHHKLKEDEKAREKKKSSA